MTLIRKNIMLGTAGHVDHGKTALIKMLTGCSLDRLAEEQRRGLTIDIGYAPCLLSDSRIVGVVDVPGHVDFIRNMVAGAHGIDVVIFVIAADDGVMPQTREHLDILTLMGVRHGVIALTKIDLVDADLLELVKDDIHQFVAGTFLAEAPICPLSNITGEGYEDFLIRLNVVADACEPHVDRGIFRLWVSEAFRMRGFGTVVTGIPSHGHVRVGDQLHLTPGGQVGRVRRLEVYGEEASEGRAGECVACNLNDLTDKELTRGTALCGSAAIRPVTMAEAQLCLLDIVSEPLKDYSHAHLHVGTAETMAHIAVLDDSHIYPGRAHLVQLRLDEPLALIPGDRFVIRLELPGKKHIGLTTIGGGIILGASNLRLRRHRPWTLEMLAARRAALGDPLAWCAQLLREAGKPMRAEILAEHALVTLEEVTELLTALSNSAEVLHTESGYLHRAVVDEAAQKISTTLTLWYADHSTSLGVEAGVLPSLCGLDRPIIGMALARLLAAGIVLQRGSVLALATHTQRIPEGVAVRMEKLAEIFSAAGLCPPALDELPALLGEKLPRVDELLRLLIEDGQLVRIAPEMVIHRDAVQHGRQVVIRLLSEQRQFTTMEFRDALGVSRKYAVPLLDYFDQQRLTVRNGNMRTGVL